jgi:hypothetical protein
MTSNIEIPEWIDKDYVSKEELETQDEDTICLLKEIATNGCASGVYMPAVTYHTAIKTMNKHGDTVFEYLKESQGEIPEPPEDARTSWSHMACYYLSMAVELWSMSTLDELDIGW